MIATKSIKQSYMPNQELIPMMETFRQMVNHCINLGYRKDEKNISTLKKFSSLYYHELDQFQIQSYYKLTAMSQACGRLSLDNKLRKKGKISIKPHITKPYLVSCYGFKINGMLLSIPVSNRNYVNIILNDHTQQILSDKSLKVRSFVITPDSISLCIQKQVEQIIPTNALGIDRNLRNVTVGNHTQVIIYNTTKLLSIKENSQFVRASFTRNDTRVKNKFFTQRKNRQARRVQQFLHWISKDIVCKAKESNSIIIFEDLKGIRKLYRKGNGQGNKFRRRLNGWSFYELQRQIQYKSAWEGILVEFVDPKRTSQLCPICGDRIQEDRLNRRKLLCINCGKSMDRDVVASMNIAHKGVLRFITPRGLSDEAVKGNVENLKPLILRVDGSKLQIQK